jgi:hypothetical protein
MCAIFGSSNLDKFKELHKLNSYRGQVRWSHFIIDPTTFNILYKNSGDGIMTEFKELEGYHLGHIQAPTTNSTNNHPAQIEDGYLWHNGILKDKTVKELQSKLSLDTTWDTMLLFNNLDELNNIDGTFSCVNLEAGKYLNLFRNKLSPLFVDDDMNISSTKFVGSKPTTENEVLCVNLINKTLTTIEKFTTKYNPYWGL